MGTTDSNASDALQEARRLLSRRAAAESQGRVLSHATGSLYAPLYTRLPGARIDEAFSEFIRCANAFVPGDEIVATVSKVRSGLSVEYLTKEVQRWVTKMDEAETSSLRLAVSYKASDPLVRGNRFATEVMKLYTLREGAERTLLLVPGHILSWARERRAPFRHLGKYSPHDSEAVLDILLGLYDPSSTDTFKDPKQALRAARALANG